ncbi:MAG: hypothetical protein ACKVOK_15950 [Flavobacteriales bacterium]
MIKFKWYRVLFILMTLFLSGCYEYVDVYEEAKKDLFYSTGPVKFRNFQNNYILNLEAHPYTCEYGTPSEYWQTYHTYRRIYPQICGQQVRRSDDQTSQIDHSISVRSSTNNSYNYEMSWIFFENDIFVTNPLTDVDSAGMVNLGINGVLYSDVFVLHPKGGIDSGEINAVYFHPKFGILRIVGRNSDLWERVLE